MALPSSKPAAQVTAADAAPGVAETPVGGSGTVKGVIAAEGSDAAPVPTPLVAVTVNVYESPFVRPRTVHPIVPSVEQVCPPIPRGVRFVAVTT